VNDTAPTDVGDDEHLEAVTPGADESEQSELDLGVISTGVTAVDQALSPLEGMSERPVDRHAEIFERILGDLSATMRDGTDETHETGGGETPAIRSGPAPGTNR
jgi:hypothetical protein